jgi:hypothetical protein
MTRNRMRRYRVCIGAVVKAGVVRAARQGSNGLAGAANAVAVASGWLQHSLFVGLSLVM